MCAAPVLVNTSEQSKALDERAGPMIIISASGMATGGRVVHHLKRFLPDPNNLVVLAGFQAPGTRGASLSGGAARVRIHGQEVPVRAEIAQLKSASSHADANELIDWLRAFERAPRSLFITHGEPTASEALRQRVQTDLGWSASVPTHGQRIQLR